jgi:hypothetical protein
MVRPKSLLVVTFAVPLLQAGAFEAQEPQNLILFVPDGLRALSVTPDTAPAMARLRD